MNDHELSLGRIVLDQNLNPLIFGGLIFELKLLRSGNFNLGYELFRFDGSKVLNRS